MRQILGGVKHVEYEVEKERNDGIRISCIVTATPFRGPDGELIGIVVNYKDITERKRIQQHLQQQERLSAVGQLAAGIAHDFNNILMGIIGNAQLLWTSADVPESAKENLKSIMEEGQRAEHLVRQILDFSRKSITQQMSFDLRSFLKESIKFLRCTIPESCQIILEMAPGDYLVNADRYQIQQVLINLAVNAQDAMPVGGELRFRLSRFTLDSGERPPFSDMQLGEWIVLSVSDTGVGISSEVLPHIYEPFFTTKWVEENTGLGLAQVYGIVKQHDGFIDVESQIGEGTTFIIYLPSLDVKKETIEEKATEELLRGRGETILVVEDEPDVLTVIEKMLEQLGYRVLTSANGQEGVKVYDQHKEEIAMVLADMFMPGMSGMGLFHVLKEQDPNVKVVMMSGYSLEKADEELLSHGIVNWVQKPMGFTKLGQIVNKALT